MRRVVVLFSCSAGAVGRYLRSLTGTPSGACAAAAAALVAVTSPAAVAGQSTEVARPIPTYPHIPKGPPSFFVTSRGLNGGDLGGLAGADRHCQKLASEAGFKAKGWRAYLSTQVSRTTPAVNARDRIRVAENLAHLHGDTLDYARAGNLVSQATALTERGGRIAGKNDPEKMQHDILTGSTAAGRAFQDRYDRTCRNWTYAGPDGSAQVGHSDRDSLGLSISWNAAHHTAGCTPAGLERTGGAGLFYCFATQLPSVEGALPKSKR
jgi:hypothetical protein